VSVIARTGGDTSVRRLLGSSNGGASVRTFAILGNESKGWPGIRLGGD
jgi:hypothetical protein